jgi:two-component system cell cycle sensor histidine kinase/response regulator CckA
MSVTTSEKQIPSGGPKEWILLVDDDVRVRRMVIGILAVTGIEVVEAANGSEALHVLTTRAHEPVMMLIDVLMPGIDGLTLARRVRARLRHTMLVCMSGHVTNRALWPAEIQQVAFLVKPFRAAALLDLVELARLGRGGGA